MKPRREHSEGNALKSWVFLCLSAVFFAEVVHQYPDVTIRLTLFNASLSEGVPQISSNRTTRQKRFFRFFCRAVFLTEFSPYFFENLDRVSEKCYTESGNRIKISKVLFIFRQRQTKQENFRLHTVE